MRIRKNLTLPADESLLNVFREILLQEVHTFMKILRITLNNIASLAGTHTVDFTRDPLRSAGLFSISGATGAGKSTLLDALCLALYDATPRLNQVGRLAELANGEKQNDPRNLLRRGAGEGFAEVAFMGVDGRTYTPRDGTCVAVVAAPTVRADAR